LKITYSYFDLKEKIEISKELRKLISCISQSEDKKLEEINIIFTSNCKMLEINKNYLKHNYLTDIITFSNSVKEIIKGDIYICLEEVTKNAKRFMVRKDIELVRVIIHGVLHLIGYTDEDIKSKRIMKSKEDKYIKVSKRLGII
jgi:probable rRNA maturation factor